MTNTFKNNDVYNIDTIKTNEIDKDLSCKIEITCVLAALKTDPCTPFPIAIPFIYGSSFETEKLKKIHLSNIFDRQFLHIDLLLYDALEYIKRSILSQIKDSITPMFISYWALSDFNALCEAIMDMCSGAIDFDSAIQNFRYFEAGIKHKKTFLSNDTIAFLDENNLQLYKSTNDHKFLATTYSVDNIFGLALALLHFIANETYRDFEKLKHIKLKCCHKCGKYFITHNAKTKYCSHTIVEGKACSQRADNENSLSRSNEFPLKKKLDKRLYEFKMLSEDTIICENITRADLYEKWLEVSGYHSKRSGFAKWLEKAESKLLKVKTQNERRQIYSNFYFWLCKQEVENVC